MAGDEGATVHVPTALIEPATSAAPGAAAAPAIARRFLIVTAPFNAFARELAQALRAKGITVERVLLNAGDWLYWGWRDAIAYRGRVKDWEAWIGRQIRDRGVTDIITFGDTTHYASAALRAARALGVETHIFEEGYFRPNWITLERDGINALSSLPRDPAWYAAHPLASVPEPDGQIGPAVGAMVRQMSVYHIVMMLGALAFPHFRTGYQDGVFAQGVGHVFRYGGAGLAAGRNKRALARALASSGKVFLVLLQRPGDSQLRIHSPFDHVVTFIRDVMTSFARNAPPDARLLIRPHPLDPGLTNYGRVIARIARELEVEGRVEYADYGKLHDVLPKMRGVVCVNSTAGLAGVEFGIPTITLGEALYDMPGLTHQGELEDFWRAPQAPQPGLYLAFRRVLMGLTQINGGYATPRARKMALETCVSRLLAPRTAPAEVTA